MRRLLTSPAAMATLLLASVLTPIAAGLLAIMTAAPTAPASALCPIPHLVAGDCGGHP